MSRWVAINETMHAAASIQVQHEPGCGEPVSISAGDGKVECLICHARYKSLSAHLRLHGWNQRDYRQRFPGAPIHVPGAQGGRPRKVAGDPIIAVEADGISGAGETHGGKVPQAETENPASMTDSLPATCMPVSRIKLLSGASLQPEPVRWIWPGWLAAGKLHLLAGAPSSGKTTMAMGFAATITVGGCWPDGTVADAGHVLVWSAEDDPADSLLPRFLGGGGDPQRIHFVGHISEDGRRRPFDPATDFPDLVSAARQLPDLRLIILDPLVSAVSADSHRNAEVRRCLQPVVDAANELGCGVLGITHFSKGTQGRDPLDRVTGSLAFGALARLVMCTARPAGDGGKRRLVRAKSNIGADGDGFEYVLENAVIPEHPGVTGTRVMWGDPLEGHARTLLAEVERPQRDSADTTSALGEAERFLLDMLATGPVPTNAIKADAEQVGLSWKTVRNAKASLAVQSVKVGMEGGWCWKLPEGAHDDPKMPSQERGASSAGEGHLREKGAQAA